MVVPGVSFEAAVSVPWRFLVYALLALVLVWKMLEQLWWRPRRLEKALRAQGIRGTPYRFPLGDVRDYGRMSREAWSRPLPLQWHDIVAHVAPFLHAAVREHGKTCFTWLGPTPKVTIGDAVVAREVLSNKLGHLEKAKFPALSKLLAHGLAGIDGDKWAKHRCILNPAFHHDKIKRMLPALSVCSEELVGRWTESVGSGGSFELDVWPEFQNLTGDAISRTVFGSSAYLEAKRISQLHAEQADRIMSNIRKITIPGYLFLPTKNNRRMHQINNEVESILRGIVGKRIQAMKDDGDQSGKDDLLGLLLESNMRHRDEMGQSSIGMMTEDDIIQECKLLYFAGTETTSVLLTWTMIMLSMHPEWQHRAREEIIGMFGKNKPQYDGLSRLKTVTMILHEVLRLYPPAININRNTYKEIEIRGVTYPAGVRIEIPVMFIHHDGDIWGDDVDEFRPERFAEGVSKAAKDPAAPLSFGWGPRICIGQNLALLEAKMAICMIIQHFEFELAPAYTHAPHVVITLRPMHGAQIRLRAI